MSLQFNEEQQSLQDSLRRFFREEVSSEYLLERAASEQESDPALWSKLLDLGLTEYFADGEPGSVGGLRELAIVSYEAGRVLLPENLLESILFGPFLMDRLLSNGEKEQLTAQLGSEVIVDLVSGKKRVSFIPFASGLNSETVLKEGEQATCSGEIQFVASALQSSVLVGVGRCESGEEKLFLLDREQAGGSEPQSALDLSLRRFTLSLESTPCLAVSSVDPKTLLQFHGLLTACELAGLCGAVVDMTVEYVGTRKQFGVPVGGFQAVQHKLAEMHLDAEAMRALAFFGAWAADHSPDQVTLCALAAKDLSTRKAVEVVERSVQLHGGIGFTYEHHLHLYLRRAKMYEILYGSRQQDHEKLLNAV